MQRTERRRAIESGSGDALGTMLAIGLEALGIDLDALARDKLLRYVALIAKWNRVYNLTAVREPAAMLPHHILDSLAVAPILAARLDAAAHCIDVGSGAGLPGVPLAIAWPHRHLTLVEPVGKKAAFLRQCMAELELQNVSVAATHVERLRIDGTAHLVISRAFASLHDFAEAVAPIVSAGTLLAAMKGRNPAGELAALNEPGLASPSWRVESVLAIDVPELDAERHLVLFRSTG